MALWPSKKKAEAKEMDKGTEGFVAWLADAALYIDSERITAFYNAVVAPETEQGKMVLTTQVAKEQEGEVAAGLEGSLGLPRIFPGVKGSINARARRGRSSGKSQTVELFPVEAPERKLLHLALHYVFNIRHRLFLVEDPIGSKDWRSPSAISELPRGLVFLDFAAGVKLMPVAAEAGNGKVIPIFENLGKKLALEGEEPPSQPDTRGMSEPQQAETWHEYWDWYAKRFSAHKANKCLEEAVAGGTDGRVRWIDYRIPLDGESQPLHVHLSSGGAFDIGVFAYNMIQRGRANGLRIVGTLRSAPGVTVLAVFEK